MAHLVGIERVLVAGYVVENAVCDDGKMLGEVEASGYYEERKKEEKHRVC